MCSSFFCLNWEKISVKWNQIYRLDSSAHTLTHTHTYSRYIVSIPRKIFILISHIDFLLSVTITLNYYQYRYIDVFCSLLAPAALTKKRISKETPTVIVLSQLFAIIEYSSGELSLCHYFSALKSKENYFLLHFQIIERIWEKCEYYKRSWQYAIRSRTRKLSDKGYKSRRAWHFNPSRTIIEWRLVYTLTTQRHCIITVGDELPSFSPLCWCLGGRGFLAVIWTSVIIFVCVLCPLISFTADITFYVTCNQLHVDTGTALWLSVWQFCKTYIL